VETQRDFLEVNYKISFVKNVMWVAAEIAGGIGCIVAAGQGVGDYLLPCGIVLLVMGAWGLSWPGIRALIGYKKALKTYGGKMKPSIVTFGKDIVNETPNGTMTVPYDTVKTIHFLTNSFVIEDEKGVGVLVSKRGFGDADFMDCVNFLCEECSNLEL
jgi:hypothetical protein